MQNIKLSDYIAEFLAKNGIKYIFGIIGSANAYLFDSINKRNDLNLICMHHEQACIMAAHGYYMQSGNMAAVLVTAGAGTTNALTGVVGAWADSVPILIISGQEATKQFKNKNISRMIGVQGVFTESIYKSCTKRVKTCQSINETINELNKCMKLSKSERYGPCIVDIPIDLQGAKIPGNKKIITIDSSQKNKLFDTHLPKIKELANEINISRKPLFWLGNGLRGMLKEQLENILKDLNIPYLTSWTATDMIEPLSYLNAGHAGTYGSRSGNLILQSCDLLVTFGTRLAIPQKGYVDNELSREANIYVVEIDKSELKKLGKRFQNKINADAKLVISELYKELKKQNYRRENNNKWLDYISKAKKQFPILDPVHKKKDK